MKQLAEDYCQACFPNDPDKADKLFEDLCSGVVTVTPEEMQQYLVSALMVVDD